MDRRLLMSPESAQASDIFDKFCTANTLKGILNHYRQLCNVVKLKPTHFPDFYPKIRQKLCSWRAQGLWSKFEKRASNKCYARGKACSGSRVLIIGGGPCGLRTAIEAQLLGAKVVLIEKRDRFSRNNVLHLWPFVITDLKALGAKKFYGKFCAGSIDHISIRQLQCILLKVALLLGVEVHEGVGFEGLREPTDDEGWRAVTSPIDHPVSHYSFNCLIGADGRRNTLEGFKRKALRAKLAIAITANFINKRTEAEARVKEISGVSYIFNQKFFQDLNEATGIDLENIVYYKDETHYFVMTAKKQSLLSKGVLLNDYADTAKLLSHENISTEALMIYSLEAAVFSTENQLSNLEFAVNHYGQPDVAMFDFTAMYAAENACRVIKRNGHKLMMTLVGDSLLEPFWPTGSGCARGFLSSFDACWMLRGLASGSRSTLEVIAERESIYRLLGQTTPENLNKEHMGYTIDPHSRYPNLNQRVVMPFQVKSLFDTDEVTDSPDGISDQDLIGLERMPKRRRRDSVIPVDSLLTWLKDQVQCYGLEINSVTDTFVRGDILCAIIHRFRPDLIEFPPVSEENMEPLEMVAQRNQMAFDFLHKEYGIAPVLTGEESVHVSPSDFHTLVAYLSQLHDIFKGEIPQIKYPRLDGNDEPEEPSYRSSQSHIKYGRPTLVVKQGTSIIKIGRRSRISSASRDGDHSDVSRKYRKRRTDERSRISLEEREKRHEEIERNRMERQRRRMQERMLQTERFIKSMRMLQMNDRSEETQSSNGVDTFDDYTFHLYRQMAPDWEDRCKSLEKKLFFSGKEIRTSVSGQAESEKQHVTGLAKHIEEKLKGSKSVEKKPKDLMRAIGKIEKSDWNVKLIEKKIAENKGHGVGKKEQDKVPKWSREAYDDKRDAMKRKMEGVSEKNLSETTQLFEETVKKLGNKLKEGNTLDIGQRGCNKVSQMAEQLAHKLERPTKESEPVVKQSTSRPVFEFPTKGGSEPCHFCNERVYVVERMTTEGKYFHRNCFRCEYCNTSLRLGNYVFDREGRYGERFYCPPHYTTIKLYGWKKFDQECVNSKVDQDKFSSEGRSAFLTPTSHQILSEMDDRGTTPERVEFENSVDFASEEELLSEMDEDEWTDRNFGASNADNNTSDEASDLSDDEEVTPDGNMAARGQLVAEAATPVVKTKVESSDSDTEKASGAGSASGEDELSDEAKHFNEDDDEDGEDEEEGDECEGSTTEVETDSEFAEDPPHCVPGSIPTIVVDEPEQLLTKFVESGVSNTNTNTKFQKTTSQTPRAGKSRNEVVYAELPYVEPVLKHELPKGRALPKVYSTPKKWEPLPAFDSIEDVTKFSIELKKKYLHGTSNQVKPVEVKKSSDVATKNQFTSLLDMISEKQKLLQPASKPSPSMQAFLEGAEKLKTQMSHSTLGGIIETSSSNETKISPNSAANISNDMILSNKAELEMLSMNLLNLEKTKKSNTVSPDEIEKGDPQKEMLVLENEIASNHSNEGSELLKIDPSLTASDGLSSHSQSKTESQCTIVEVNNDSPTFGALNDENQSECGSEAESISCDESSDIDEMVLEKPPLPHYPPRVEIEDEFGVSVSIDENKVVETKQCNVNQNIQERVHSTKNCEVSSSESKDSLNSEAFLETELSELSHAPGAQIIPKSQMSERSISNVCTSKAINKMDEEEVAMKLNLDTLDFADIDGVSSFDSTQKEDIKKVDQVPSIQSTSCAHGGDPFIVKTNQNCHENSGSYRAGLGTDADESLKVLTKSSSGSPAVKNELKITKDMNYGVQSSFHNHSGPVSGSISDKDKFAILDRVVPFSKARDSLDYRKMKSTTNPLKSVEPFLEHKFGSNAKPLKLNHSNQESKTLLEDELRSSYLEATEFGNRASTSPSTTRRIHEINKERSKQNDLIRSMVMGRIRRSPEKNRRGSRRSMSPTGVSSSGSSDFTSKLDRTHIDDGISDSAGSLCSVGDEAVNLTLESGQVKSVIENNITGEENAVEPVSPKEIGQSDIDFNDSLDMALRAKHGAGARTRPIFDSPLSIYQSATNPSTPVNSLASGHNPLSQPRTDKLVQEVVTFEQSHSPNYYRSMPDLSAAMNELNVEKEKHKVNKVSSFAAPSAKKLDEYPPASVHSQERARVEARERARLKSDEELGLTPSNNYNILTDKLKRKLSFAEDDVFNPNAAITTRVYSHDEPTSTSTPVSNPSSYTIAELEQTLEGTDNVATCIRQNVDFPLKKNPFLVSPQKEQERSITNSLGKQTKDLKDDFLQLRLHVSPKTSKADEKLKDAHQDSPILQREQFPSYFSQPSSGPSPNWQLERIDVGKVSPQKAHTRSYTVSGIDLGALRQTSGNSDLSSYSHSNCQASKDPIDGKLTHAHGHSSTNALSQPAYSPHFAANSSNRSTNKTKALSTEMLLDTNKFSLAPETESFRGVSVPDVTHDFVPSDRKSKRSKDRTRRRSLIQAVSDFFTTKSPGNKTPSSTTDPEKSSSTSSSSPATPKENKFSIFKLTPKLLQKEKASPPSGESNPWLARGSTRSFEKAKPSKHPRSSFMSYLSQPEILVQRLSSSPAPSKSIQSNFETPKISNSKAAESNVRQGVISQTVSSSEKQRKSEILEIQLQLESIETEQRQLECKGVSIERKLRGEEDDEGQEGAELMEEWFTLVREKIRLSRYEKELIVRAKELELDWKEEKLEQELEMSLVVPESDKSPQLKSREIELFQELNSLKRQREALLTSFHEDMMKYELEDADLEARCSTLSPRESDV